MHSTHQERFTGKLKKALLLFLAIFLALFSSFAFNAPSAVLAAAACPPGEKCYFFPMVTGGVPTSADLVLNNIEITQAVQNTVNSVPMVAGRPTALRIFATSGSVTSEAAQSISNVQVEVTATRNGVALNNSMATFQPSVPLSSSRADYNSTVNMLLPADWLSGTIELNVRIDPENAIRESNENNNSMAVRLTFNQVPALRIKIVPIYYTHTPNGRSYTAPSVDTISSWMYRIYPVNQIEVSWHTAYPFTGNLSSTSDWQRLLDQITSLKRSEGAPASTVYYGLVPVSDAGSTWFYSGVAGIGWIGSRTSVGLNTTSTAAQIAAHEIGHNLGMWHAPCGGAAGVDPEFPYSNGSIGAYGLDLATGTVYRPDSSRDLMTYCTPRWISDYTYRKLYTNQVRYGAASPQLSLSASQGAAQRSLLFRAMLNGQGAALAPVYVLPGGIPASVESGQYTVQMYGAQGDLLSEVSVREQTMGLDGAEVSAINALIPMPEAQVTKIRLVKSGQVLAEQDLQANDGGAAGPLALSQENDRQVVRWENSAAPAMLRYSLDGGETWTTLGIDLQGGELVVDPAMLPGEGGEFQLLPANTWN